jgi:transposase-like protein
MKRSVAADRQRRAEALRLLDQGMGAAEVARRLDVPAGTVRSWAHRAGKAGPPSGADPLSWAERKQRTADRAYTTAMAALVRTRKLLDSGMTREAKDAALTAAILLDKSGGLEAG